jgi:prolyl oligopeptidase
MRTTRTFLTLLLLFALSCGGTQQQTYGPPPPEGEAAASPAERPEPTAQPPGDWPPTRREDVVEVVQGVSISDPYRWLEKVDDPMVKEWMNAQDAVTRKKLEQLGVRPALRDRFRELVYIDSVTAPYHEGKRYFYTRSHSDKEKSIVYYRDGEKGAEKVLIDPNTLSADGSISLGGWWPAQNGRLVAYKLKKNNSDAATMYVRDLDAGKDLEKDVIEGAKYAAAAWTPQGGDPLPRARLGPERGSRHPHGHQRSDEVPERRPLP